MTTPTESSLDNVAVKRGRVDSLTLYEVTDYELELLEKGSPASLNLNFSIFLFSIGLSYLSTILIVKIESIRTYTFFCLIAIVGLVVGLVLCFLWLRDRSNIKTTSKKIKDRITTCDSHNDSEDAETKQV